MRITRFLLVLLVGGSLVGACSKEEKKGEGAKASEAEGQAKAADTPTATTPATTAPAKPFGNKLAGLLGGGKGDAQKGGILGGLGLADVGNQLGGIGAGGAATGVAAEQAGTPPAVPASAPAATPTPTPVAKAPAAPAGAGQCVAVADHLLKIMKKELAAGMADVPPELAAELEKQLAGAKGQIVAECQKSNWPPAVHQCLLGATDMNALTQCESLVTGGAAVEADDTEDVDLSDLDMADIPTEVQSSGDAECDKLAEHVFKVMIGKASPEEREMVEAMKAMVVNELSKQCASTPWPKPARDCISKATSEASLEQCASQHGLE